MPPKVRKPFDLSTRPWKIYVVTRTEENGKVIDTARIQARTKREAMREMPRLPFRNAPYYTEAHEVTQ